MNLTTPQPLLTEFAVNDLMGDSINELLPNDDYLQSMEDDSRVTVNIFKNHKIPINTLFKHTGLFGTTGAGKTYTMAVKLENLSEFRVPFTCWDYEGSSYYTIPEVYKHVKYTEIDPLIRQSTYDHYISNMSDKDYKGYFSYHKGEHQLNYLNVPEAQDRIEEIEQLAELNYYSSAQQIISFDKMPDQAMKACIAYVYTKKLWSLATDAMEKEKHLLHINIFDEGQWALPSPRADVPTTYMTPLLMDQLRTIAGQGRKRWMLLWVASQRLTDINSNIRSQLQNVLLLKAGPMDIPHYRGFMTRVNSSSEREDLLRRAMRLRVGQGMFVHKGQVYPNVLIAKRKSRHPDESASYYKAMRRSKMAQMTLVD
jgi:hypothetical protein